MTVATALAARTTSFQPLVTIRTEYWHPVHFASAATTLDQLSGGRLLVNVVSGQDNLGAHGDSEGDQAQRYAHQGSLVSLQAARISPTGSPRSAPTRSANASNYDV